MLKKLSFILILLVSYSNFGFEVATSTTPSNPIENETFKFRISIKGDLQEEPDISFDPRGAEVLGRSCSIGQTIINGRSQGQSYTCDYELNPERSGIVNISNIRVSVDGENKKIRSARIKISKENKINTNKDIFLRAEPSKTSVYLGEAIDVQYYLYHRVRLISPLDVLRYPKFQNFIKRFKTGIRPREEIVQVGSTTYRRSPQYIARIFPQKVGTLKIDPMKMSIRYQKQTGYSPFGHLGISIGGGRTLKKSLSSQEVLIEVKSLPTLNMPKNFTGLVGSHEFTLSQASQKFLVNEPVEIKLEVKGDGLLETYAGPSIYTHHDLDDFDTKSEFVELPDSSAKKTFEYTYLGRGPLEIKPSTLELYHFDPIKEAYILTKIPLVGLVIDGMAQKNRSQQPNPPTVSEPNNNSRNTFQNFTLLAPFFTGSNFSSLAQISNIYKLLLLILALIILESIYQNIKMFYRQKPIEKAAGRLKKKPLSYSGLYSLFSHSFSSKNESMSDVIKRYKLPEETRAYFLKLIDGLSSSSYASGKKLKNNEKINKKHLQKFVEAVKNENC